MLARATIGKLKSVDERSKKTPLPIEERRLSMRRTTDLLAAHRCSGGLGSGAFRLDFVAWRWNRLLVMGSEEAYAFEVMLSHHMQAKEVRRTRLGARAGHNGDDLARLHKTALFEQALG